MTPCYLSLVVSRFSLGLCPVSSSSSSWSFHSGTSQKVKEEPMDESSSAPKAEKVCPVSSLQFECVGLFPRHSVFFFMAGHNFHKVPLKCQPRQFCIPPIKFIQVVSRSFSYWCCTWPTAALSNASVFKTVFFSADTWGYRESTRSRHLTRRQLPRRSRSRRKRRRKRPRKKRRKRRRRTRAVRTVTMATWVRLHSGGLFLIYFTDLCMLCMCDFSYWCFILSLWWADL